MPKGEIGHGSGLIFLGPIRRKNKNGLSKEGNLYRVLDMALLFHIKYSGKSAILYIPMLV